LARAIVVYVQNTVTHETDVPLERPLSWLSVPASAGLSAFCIWIVVVLFHLVGPATDVWYIVLIVLGQAILTRLAIRGIRSAFMAACDGLNEASYPTNLHPIRNAGSGAGAIRLRRLRALVIETADRIAAGSKPDELVAELSTINLTPRAARFLVRIARVRASLREYFPPYQSRWLGYTLATAFVITAVISIHRLGDRLAEGLQNYAICVAFWIAGDLAARPRTSWQPTDLS